MVTPLAREMKYSATSSDGVSQTDVERAWALTRQLSPQKSVRIAAESADSAGVWMNVYSGRQRIDGAAPASPWAMNLFDTQGQARYLCFDFDAKKGNAQYDAGRMRMWLDELNIATLWCISGPSRGVHLWVGLDEPVDARLVLEVARMAAHLLPSLDPVPMSNARTGAVRPPLTPHRLGGRSEPQGPVTVLTAPTTTADDVRAVRQMLLDLGAEVPQPWGSQMHGVRLDAAGQPYVAGVRRGLSPRITAMLEQPPAADTSLTVATVFAACANARWRLDDVRELVDWSPALEHIRSIRTSDTQRLSRTAAGRARALESSWRSAVAFVASNPTQGQPADTEYLARAEVTSSAIATVQERADASPGLWSGGRTRSTAGTFGYASRAVLDAVCLFMAQAARTDVEVDVRRLSAETGYGRTRAAEALRWLIDDLGWLEQESPADGANGQKVRLAPQFFTESNDSNRTQVLARPRADSPQPLNFWTSLLGERLQSLRHDVFVSPRSLGRTAGRIYQLLSETEAVPLAQLAADSRIDPALLRRSLSRLVAEGLVSRLSTGWRRGTASARDVVAAARGVDGYLRQRAARYATERAVWAWWGAELQWMRKRDKRRKVRRQPTAVSLFVQPDRPEYARYPRGPDHRGDHVMARRLVEAGVLEAQVQLLAA